MNTLFTGNDTLKFDRKYNLKIENVVNSFKGTLAFQHDKFLNEGNNFSKVVVPILLMTVVYVLGLIISYKIDPEVEKIIGGIAVYVISLVVFFVASFLTNRVSWKFLIPAPIIAVIGIFGFIKAGNNGSELINFGVCYFFIILGFTSLVIYQYLIKRPSEEKLRKKSLIEGFKMYMGAAENEQLKFHNPPQMTPQVFETLLPFAMVLGVDDIWGKKFETMVKNMASGTEYVHVWYIGSSINHLSFGNTLNSSLTNSIRSASTQPSSSSSGSGGGGFSGGGGGGW